MIKILFPSNLNWFYKYQAELFADDLNEASLEAEAVAADEFAASPRGGSVVLILSLWESIESLNDPDSRLAFMQALRSVKYRVLLNYDCLFTQYFRRHFIHEEDLITHVIDIGYIRQTSENMLYSRPYFWMPECFTAKELAQLKAQSAKGAETHRRVIPWAMLGHANESRSTLVMACMQKLSPGGLVFLPPVRPFDSSNGFEAEAIRNILTNVETYVWGSHHPFPYHEGLRAHHAVAAGAVPLKVDPIHFAAFNGIPWVHGSLTSFVEELASVGRDDLFARCLAHATKGGVAAAKLQEALRSFRIGDAG